MLRIVGLLLVAGCAGSGEPAPSPAPPSPLVNYLEDPGRPLPARLSELGLYQGGGSAVLAPEALGYAPAYELWSDGGDKQRALSLPAGTTVDAHAADAYVFPVGTLLSKTFSFRTPNRPSRAVPVETRLLRLGEDGWEYFVYGWDDAAEEAELLDLRRAETREVLDDEDAVVRHAIPSRLECRQCHESSTSAVLGMNELQLAASGSLETLAPRLEPAPAPPYAALPAGGPLTTAVLGYFTGNCVHCHNGSNGAASSFDLRAEVALSNLVNHPTASSATSDGIRIVPGEPEQSVLFQGLRGGALDVKDMPPLGVAQRDARGLALVRDFILALAASSDP